MNYFNILTNEINNITINFGCLMIILILINNLSFLIWFIKFNSIMPNYIYNKSKIKENIKVKNISNNNKGNFFLFIINPITIILYHVISITLFVINIDKSPLYMGLCIAFAIIYIFNLIHYLILLYIADREGVSNE